MTDHLESLHKVDYKDTLEGIKKIRKLRNELEEGKRISINARKSHNDKMAPNTKESRYRFDYLNFKMPQKLVFGTPRLPKYPLRWLGDTSSRTTNKKLLVETENAKQNNILINHPRRPF